MFNKRLEILGQLNEIDRQSIRPIRAGDQERLTELEARAKALREELNAL